MTDQVNPLGSLAPGMAQTPQAIASLPSKPPPKPAESKAQSHGTRADDPSRESTEAAAKEVQDFLQQLPVDIKFIVDRDTGMVYFKLIDPVTQKVIRQIPSEEILAMSRKLRALSDTQGASGVLMDKEG